MALPHHATRLSATTEAIVHATIGTVAGTNQAPVGGLPTNSAPYLLDDHGELPERHHADRRSRSSLRRKRPAPT
jgi:hypothetical protein